MKVEKRTPEHRFCMGGPGILLSRGALKLIKAKIDTCFDKLLTEHEDLELGRCIWRITGKSCTSAADVERYYFYQDMKRWGTEDAAFINDDAEYAFGQNINIGNLKDETLAHALTMHANKEPIGQLKTHAKILDYRIRSLRQKIKLLNYYLIETKLTSTSNVLASKGYLWS